MDECEYIRQRVDEQIDWYDKKSKVNQKKYKILYSIEIILSAALTASGAFFNNFILKVISTSIGACCIILTNIMNLCKFQENWIQYRITSETLKNEKFLFLTKSGLYSEKNNFSLFVERIENILSKENLNWFQYVVANKNKEDK